MKAKPWSSFAFSQSPVIPTKSEEHENNLKEVYN
jgi:hypothetical protein